MFIQKTYRSFFAACSSLFFFVGLETKASAFNVRYTDNYVVLNVVNLPSGQNQYELTALVSDSNAFADYQIVVTSENGIFTSPALNTKANYVWWRFNLIPRFGDAPALKLTQNALNAGFYVYDDDYSAETPDILNEYGATAYLTFDYNTFILDANIEQVSPPQPVPVPEPDGELGLLTFGILSASYLLTHQLRKSKKSS